MLTLGKFSMFSLTTMSVNSVPLKDPVYFEMDWVRYCERELPNYI